MRNLRIGVVGYSSANFDEAEARALLKKHITEIVEEYGSQGCKYDAIEVVSGLTNYGVPKLAYELATEMGLLTIGISAEEALEHETFPVDKVVIEGEKFGDESETFLNYIDCLVRIGGGQQSMAETRQFKKICAADQEKFIIEEDL